MEDSLTKSPAVGLGKQACLFLAMVALCVAAVLCSLAFTTNANAVETDTGGTSTEASNIETDDSGRQSIERLSGNEAQDTAKEIALKAFEQVGEDGKTTYEQTDNVVVACNDDFADAMSATGLAGALNAPILLTERTQLSSAVSDVISTLGAKNVYIIGGVNAVKPDVEAALKALSGIKDVKRVAGYDYFDTSVKCAEEIKTVQEAAGKTPSSDVIVAYGQNFQDALSISSFAYKYELPIFLTTPGEGSADRGLTNGYHTQATGDEDTNLSAAAYIRTIIKDGSTIYVPGGKGAVADSNVYGFGDKVTVTRFAGADDGYDTSNVVATKLTEKDASGNSKLNGETVIVACGAETPKGVDALAGAALAGKKEGVILLVNSKAYDDGNSGNKISVKTLTGDSAFLLQNPDIAYKTYVLGGTGVLPCDKGVNFTDTIKASAWKFVPVTYNPNYEGAKTETDYAFVGRTFTKIDDPVRTGYGFMGWYTDEACSAGKEFKFKADGTSESAVVGNTPLYAKWTTAYATDDSGKASPVATDGTTTYNVIVEDTTGSAIKGASVYVDASDQVVVELPEGKSNVDVVVTVANSESKALSGKAVAVKNNGGKLRNSGTTDENGKYTSWVTNTGETSTDGKVSVTNPKTGKVQPVLVTDASSPANAISGASVTVDINGKTTVTLPAEYDNGDVVVTIYDEAGTTGVSGAEVTVNKSTGDVRDSGKTDEAGKFTLTAVSTGTTLVTGSVTLASPDAKTTYTINVTDTTESKAAIEGATVTLGNNNNVTVTLPTSTTAEGFVVKVTTDAAGAQPKAGVNVSVTSATGTQSGQTAADGTFTVDFSANLTDKNGEVTFTGKDGSAYYFKVVDAAAASTAVEGATVEVDENGKAAVTLPSAWKDKNVSVTIMSGDKKTAKSNVGVTVYDEGETDARTTGNTDTSGIYTSSVMVEQTAGASEDTVTLTSADGKTTYTLKTSVGTTGSLITGATFRLFNNGSVAVDIPVVDYQYRSGVELTVKGINDALMQGVSVTVNYDGDTLTGTTGDDGTYTAKFPVYSGFWMASVPTDATKVDEATCKAAAESDNTKVFKNAKQIMRDKNKIAEELKDGYQEATDTTAKEYKAYMTSNNVHLYTTYSGDANATGANAFAEFRIIQVGTHMNSATDTTGDGSTLTFQATHSLPTACAMNAGTSQEWGSNIGGWPQTELYTALQTNGTIFNNFSEDFRNAVTPVSKAYNVGGGTSASPSTTVQTSANNTFFVLSYSEIVDGTNGYMDGGDNYSSAGVPPAVGTEGVTYELFKGAIDATKTDVTNDLLKGIALTRTGEKPTGYSADVSLAICSLRSPTIASNLAFFSVSSDGSPNYTCYSKRVISVSPAFCF